MTDAAWQPLKLGVGFSSLEPLTLRSALWLDDLDRAEGDSSRSRPDNAELKGTQRDRIEPYSSLAFRWINFPSAAFCSDVVAYGSSPPLNLYASG